MKIALFVSLMVTEGLIYFAFQHNGEREPDLSASFFIEETAVISILFLTPIFLCLMLLRIFKQSIPQNVIKVEATTPQERPRHSEELERLPDIGKNAASFHPLSVLQDCHEAIVIYKHESLCYANTSALTLFGADSFDNLQIKDHFSSELLDKISHTLTTKQDFRSHKANIITRAMNVLPVTIRAKIYDNQTAFFIINNSKPVNIGEPVISVPTPIEIIDNSHQDSSAASPTDPHKVKGRILLVEDSLTHQLMLLDQLNDLGLDVTCANNGQEALEASKHEVFDLMLIDLQMPVMDGLTASKCIRKLPQHSHTSIIAMSSTVTPELRDEMTRSGMNEFIKKPVSKKALLTIINQWRLTPNQQPIPYEKEHFSEDEKDVSILKESIILQMIEDIGEARCNSMSLIAIEEIDKRIQRIERDIAEQNIDSLQRQAHTIKSTAASFGMVSSSESARALEFACMHNTHEQALDSKTTNTTINDLCDHLKTQFSHSKNALKDFFQQRTPMG
ncbi:response regulator [Marinomonas algicola]|uniref:response regulator n=1 Tax=Marinomonas algicola TaxID=2773454 RepID=UPI00174BBEC6|nr:response regulator [Marinomonas algicola]